MNTEIKRDQDLPIKARLLQGKGLHQDIEQKNHDQNCKITFRDSSRKVDSLSKVF